MKFIVLFIFFAAFVVVLSLLFVKLFANNKSVVKNIRNFKVRFDPAKEKYYIVNQLDTHDEDVTNCMGFRVMYKDKPKATYIADKLNS